VQDDINNEQTLKKIEEAIEHSVVLKDIKDKKKGRAKKVESDVSCAAL
jgi:hypothetical protein